MAFQDDVSAFLVSKGVALAASAAPSRETLTEGLRKLYEFLNSLDSDTAAALNEVSTNFPIKALLADPTVDIAPELGSVLQAFDESVDLPPFLTQTVKTQNPSNGELSHGVVT